MSAAGAVWGSERPPPACRGISIFDEEDVLRPIVCHRFCGGGKRARALYAPPPRTISAITSACKATRRLNRAIPTRSRNAKAGAIWKPCRRMQRACVRLQRRRARSPLPPRHDPTRVGGEVAGTAAGRAPARFAPGEPGALSERRRTPPEAGDRMRCSTTLYAAVRTSGSPHASRHASSAP